MLSNTWTPAALSSNASAASGICWRAVEAQHHVSTAKLTDSAEEQNRLEELIENSKPPIPEECRGLHYLLFTPFRYGAVYPGGSRFRRAGMSPGVFYASETPQTALAEMAFYRLLFFAESPNTPWPTNPGEYSAFSADYFTGRAINLTQPPFRAQHDAWTHKVNHAPCQSLADSARAAGIDVIKYESVRCPEHGINLAILSCRAFARPEIIDRQTWHIQINATGARLICEFPKTVRNISRDHLAADPRLNEMRWDRQRVHRLVEWI